MAFRQDHPSSVKKDGVIKIKKMSTPTKIIIGERIHIKRKAKIKSKKYFIELYLM